MITYKQTINKLQGWTAAFVCFIAVTASCSPSKNSAGVTVITPAPAATKEIKEDFCRQSIRYYIEKSIISNEGQGEKEDLTAMTLVLNPGDKKFTVMLKEGNKVESQEMNVISCSLSEGLKSGEALYEIMENKQQENGGSGVTKINLKVVADKGTANLLIYSAEKSGGIKTMVTKWEIVQ